MQTYKVRKGIGQVEKMIRVPNEMPLGTLLELDYDLKSGVLTYYPVKSSKPNFDDKELLKMCVEGKTIGIIPDPDVDPKVE